MAGLKVGSLPDYVVTAGAMVNTYSVTVTVEVPTTTLVIDLGTSPSGTLITGGNFIGSGPASLPIPALPAGSILRSITADVQLEAPDDFAFANDLTVLFDPTPGTPGGDFSFGITSSGALEQFGPPTQVLTWSGGGSGGVGATLNETKTEADWTGDIDLSGLGVFLGNAYSNGDGTWSGTITLTYDLVGGGSAYESWAGGELFGDDTNGDGVTNGIAFLLGAAGPNEEATGRLPTVSESGGGLVMTFDCLPVAARGGAVLSVQHSSDLGAGDPWASSEVPDTTGGPVNGVSFTVSPGPAGPPALNSVTATIGSGEAAGGRLFGRLEGQESAP